MKTNILKTSKNILEKFNYENDGNQFEKENWHILKNKFPNLEIFWKYFIVPITNRIDPSIEKFDHCWPSHRVSVDNNIRKIGIEYYSIFYHLIFSQYYLNKDDKPPSIFNFFIHLSIVCDLFLSFLFRLIHLIGNKINIPIFNESKYFKNAKDYYKKYLDKPNNLIDYFIRKDRLPKVKYTLSLIQLVKKIIIDIEFTDFEKNAQLIKNYRNIFLHGYLLLPVVRKGKKMIFNIDKLKLKDKELLLHCSSERDKLGDEYFIELNKLINECSIKILGNLNKILGELIIKMDKLIFIDKKQLILNLYNIDIC